MKLVELLAKELSEWPSKAGFATQDKDGEVRFMGGCGTGYDFYLGIIADYDDSTVQYGGMRYAGEVTESQWQAERDRQKGGEWKRHRGGKQPVADGVLVEVKLRDGDIQKHYAEGFAWPFTDCDVDANIMKFRVISQPQAEEVKLSRLEARMLFSKPCIVYPESAEAKTDQIDGPLRWRDCVNELDAYIEEFTRERDALIELLASEGFALIPPVVSVVSEFSGVDFSDWRNWKAGDVVECTYSDCDNVYTVGKLYDVDHVTSTYAYVSDDCGKGSFCNIGEDDSGSVRFKLIQ